MLDRGVLFRSTDTKKSEVKMRTYRLELVRESGGDELEETILRTSTDVARALRPLFKGIDREKFVVALLDAKQRTTAAKGGDARHPSVG